jgi:hypothetical protein
MMPFRFRAQRPLIESWLDERRMVAASLEFGVEATGSRHRPRPSGHGANAAAFDHCPW